MSNSNMKILRKKVAQTIEDEIFTINTDLDNMVARLTALDAKKLSKLDYSKLKAIREGVNKVKYDILNINRNLDNISNGWGEVVDLREEGLPWVIMNQRDAKNLEREIKEKNPEVEGDILDITENQNNQKLIE